jgi:outer membrane receptor protein involved in Fe transport
VLRQTPFVLVRQNSRGEAELSVRGSDSRQAALLLDGLPLTLGWDHRSDPSLVPSTGIQRLTVVRGLSSLLSGPNALGGVIALELNVRPAARVVDGVARYVPDLVLGSGVDQYAAHVVTASGGIPVQLGGGVLSVRGGATYRQRDGFALSRNGAAGDGLTGGVADPGTRARRAPHQHRPPPDRRLRGPALRRGVGRYVALTGTGYEPAAASLPSCTSRRPRLWRYPEAGRRLGVLSSATGSVATPFGRGSST